MAKFKLKAKLTKEELAGVPEALRGAYVEREGAFHLEEFEYDDKEELSGALERERKERKAAKEALAKYEGIDPEKAREAQKRLDELDEKQLIDKGEFERLLKKRSDEFDVREAEFQKQLGDRDTRLNHYELIDPVRKAALAAGVLAEDVEDVLKITSHRFRLNDKRQPVILDKDGDESSITLEKFWGEEFKAQKPKFYGASGAGGSGAPAGGSGGGSGGAKTIKRGDFDKLDQGERQRLTVKEGYKVVDE